MADSTVNIDQAFNKLIDDIKLSIDAEVSGTGFYQVFCPVCGNKDIRKGGFRFDSDKIGYHCFRGRCDASCVYEKGNGFPRKMRELLEHWNIKVPTELRLVKRKTIQASENDDRFKPNVLKPISTPKYLNFDTESDSFWGEFIQENRLSGEMAICTGGKYRGCLAIPVRLNGLLIGMEYVTKRRQYIRENNGNTGIVFSPSGRIPRTAFVIEGTLDALSLPNMVAVMASKISPEKAFHLREADRIIVIPDKKNSQLYESAKLYEWEVSLPDWGDDCNDVNDAVKKYGKLITARLIHEGITKPSRMGDIRFAHFRRGFSP